MPTIHIPPGPIDQWLRTYRDPGTEFRLGHGHYTTRGAWAFEQHDCCMVAPGCALIGSGPSTTIHCETPDLSVAGKTAVYLEALTGGSRSGESESVRFEGFRLETKSPVPVVGVHTWSSRAIIRSVRVDGIWGDRNRPAPNEGFGLIANNCGAPCSDLVDGGNLIEDCEVHVYGQYVTGCYCGIVERAGCALTASVVRRVRVFSTGTESHAGYGINDRTHIEDCESHGFRRAVFSDTGPGRDSRIARMFATACEWAVEFRAMTESDTRQRLRVSDSTFLFQQETAWSQALLIEDATFNGEMWMGPVEFERCTFHSLALNRSQGRLRGSRISGVEFRDCRWGPGPWEAPVVQSGAQHPTHTVTP